MIGVIKESDGTWRWEYIDRNRKVSGKAATEDEAWGLAMGYRDALLRRQDALLRRQVNTYMKCTTTTPSMTVEVGSNNGDVTSVFVAQVPRRSPQLAFTSKHEALAFFREAISIMEAS